MTECDFCNKEVIERQEIMSTELSRLIMPKSPIIFGNLIVTPKRHIEILTELNDFEIIDIKNLINMIYVSFQKNFGMTGYNVFSNCGESAGQSVFHNHFHIFMRSKDEKYSPYDVLNGKIKKHLLSKEEWEKDKLTISKALLHI